MEDHRAAARRTQFGISDIQDTRVDLFRRADPGVWAFPVIGTPTRASDHGSGDAQEPAAVVVDCSMHQAPRSHLFPYAVKM